MHQMTEYALAKTGEYPSDTIKYFLFWKDPVCCVYNYLQL